MLISNVFATDHIRDIEEDELVIEEDGPTDFDPIQFLGECSS
jgi:hypothetical protein